MSETTNLEVENKEESVSEMDVIIVGDDSLNGRIFETDGKKFISSCGGLAWDRIY